MTTNEDQKLVVGLTLIVMTFERVIDRLDDTVNRLDALIERNEKVVEKLQADFWKGIIETEIKNYEKKKADGLKYNQRGGSPGPSDCLPAGGARDARAKHTNS
jgi:hypothetical protein